MTNIKTIYYEPPIARIFELFTQPNFFSGRYNDGELIAIREANNSNFIGENCDGHKYF